MAELKREVIKMVRDYIKKDYKQRDKCFICGRTDTLELHHLYSLSELFNQWCVKNSIRNISTVEQITQLRVTFAEDCKEHLAHEHLYTLCSEHHKRLHNIYGQTYVNSMAPKIKNWIELQKVKYGNE